MLESDMMERADMLLGPGSQWTHTTHHITYKYNVQNSIDSIMLVVHTIHRYVIALSEESFMFKDYTLINGEFSSKTWCLILIFYAILV